MDQGRQRDVVRRFQLRSQVIPALPETSSRGIRWSAVDVRFHRPERYLSVGNAQGRACPSEELGVSRRTAVACLTARMKVWLHSGPPTRLPLGTPFDGRCIPDGCARRRPARMRPGYGEVSPKPWRRRIAPRSNTPGILGRPPSFAGHSRSRELRRDLAEALAEAGRGLPAGRLARLGETTDFHHGLLRR